MSTTHLIYDSGTILVPVSPAPPALGVQVGATLDVRKYSRIRAVAHDFPGPGAGVIINFVVKEGAIELPLLGPPNEMIIPGGGFGTVVIDVPGRELEIRVHHPGPPPTRTINLLVFGLEL